MRETVIRGDDKTRTHLYTQGTSMIELLVREARPDDEAARDEIVEEATEELRAIYRPREDVPPCDETSAGVLVAVEGKVVVGTAEYVLKDKQLYVQGLAVHPQHRGRGVCRALLRGMEVIAVEKGRPALGLCAIEESGNVAVFSRLGFEVTKRAVAPNHVSPDGGVVMRVEMERKLG